MNYESFVTTLVVAYVEHEFMQDEILAAGIKVEHIPERHVAKGTILSYLEKRKSMSHERAAFELSSDVALLSKFAEPLTAIPRDPQVLRDLYQDLFEQHQLAELGNQLRLDPKSGREKLREFQLKEASAVKHQTLSELSILVGHHLAQAKDNQAVIKINGFEKLSEMIGGFNPERLGIFLGGTGFGKTNFAVNLALAAAKTMRVAYVNMEMGYQDMVKRFAVIGSRVSYYDYATGKFSSEEVIQTLQEHGDNIHLTSGRTLSFDQISAWARSLHAKADLGLLIIDYDQKVDLNLKHQYDEWKALQKVMESFEELAKELQCYSLILAQVNREGLISGSHRAQFPAHTVLAFYEHEEHGPVIEARKNRHGKKMQALKVFYNDQNSSIVEESVVTLEPKKKEERKKLMPAKKTNQWWGES